MLHHGLCESLIMNQVGVDIQTFTDIRFKKLGEKVNLSEYEVRARFEEIWWYCIKNKTCYISEQDFEMIIPILMFFNAAIEVGLLKKHKNGKVYVCGTKQRLKTKKGGAICGAPPFLSEEQKQHSKELFCYYEKQLSKLHNIKTYRDARSNKHINMLIGKIGLEKSKRLIDEYLKEAKDQYIIDNAFPISLLYYKLQKYLAIVDKNNSISNPKNLQFTDSTDTKRQKTKIDK